jgi:hypothetical protein
MRTPHFIAVILACMCAGLAYGLFVGQHSQSNALLLQAAEREGFRRGLQVGSNEREHEALFVCTHELLACQRRSQ